MNSEELLSMTVLDVVSKNESTVEIFNSYNDMAGECICCNALFETVNDIIRKYNINSEEFLLRLKDAIKNEPILEK